jgi:hypothetical protein
MLWADSKTEPMLPRPPASETAATSFGDVAGQIAACMMGTSIPNKSHTGVRNMALLPTRSGTEKVCPYTDNMMPPPRIEYICRHSLPQPLNRRAPGSPFAETCMA